MDNKPIFKNFNYNKVNKVMMKILEQKHNIKINSKVIKKEGFNG